MSDDPEFQQFIQQTQQQVQLQASAAVMADMCWEKCVDKPGSKTIGNGSDSRTEACLTNCVDRFLEATQTIMQQMGSRN